MIYNGIDVSKHNGVIDWPRVRAAGVQFAFIRLGWAGYEGGLAEGLDYMFETNMAGAIAAGIPVGVYVYSYCKTPAAAKRAAQETAAWLRQYKVTMPVALDIETDDSTPYQSMTRAANTQVCRAFLQEIQTAGYYPMLYTYKSFANSYLDMSQLADYDFWLAHYVEQSDYTGPYGIHQYTSGGSVEGISGRVDMDRAYKDYPAIITGKSGTALSDTPVRMQCVATGADGAAVRDQLEGLGIGYTVAGNTITTAVAVSRGDQLRLTATAPDGVVWTVYSESPAPSQPEADNPGAACADLQAQLAALQGETARLAEEKEQLREEAARLAEENRQLSQRLDKIREALG